jgi:hypothetical protein
MSFAAIQGYLQQFLAIAESAPSRFPLSHLHYDFLVHALRRDPRLDYQDAKDVFDTHFKACSSYRGQSVGDLGINVSLICWSLGTYIADVTRRVRRVGSRLVRWLVHGQGVCWLSCLEAV